MADGSESDAVRRTEREAVWPSTIAAFPIETSGNAAAVKFQPVTVGLIAPL